MRKVEAIDIKSKISEMILEASYVIGNDILDVVKKSIGEEESSAGVAVLEMLLNNYNIAKEERLAICQDTGMAVIFAKVGQEVQIVGGDFEDAITQGVKDAYDKGYLRKSVVRDPLFDRSNTMDNTPTVIHTQIVPGRKVDLLITLKGFGSENMSAIKMLVPADGIEGMKSFVLDTIIMAGPNPCPPIVVGIGVGGTMEKAAILAKYATARPVDKRNTNVQYALLEKELLEMINKTGIGPGGIGGRITALGVNIEFYPTHIAGLPVAVNLCCHAARHRHAII